MNRYEHSVVDVATALHGDVRGSGDSLPDDRKAALVQWLRWRVGEGWEPSPRSAYAVYDEAVRSMVMAVLYLVDVRESANRINSK